MSLGASIPYHLRQNKAVDRYAFLALLSKLDKLLDIEKYTYIGFGGHSLEDFKYIHAQFGNRKMISIEQDENVHKRQKFNQPHSCINCQLTTSGDFIDNFPVIADFDKVERVVVWLDYVKPKELRVQIEELQSILSKLQAQDVVKITLNANPAAYSHIPPGMKKVDIHSNRMNSLIDKLGDLFPRQTVGEDMMSRDLFSTALCKVLENVAGLAMASRPQLRFQPLTSFSYADGQQMLTVTGVILDKVDVSNFLSKTGINGWKLSNLDWGKPRHIDIPDLTIRERLLIDSLLPETRTEVVQNKLGFYYGKNEDTSIEMLENYSFFYRQAPYFSKVFI